MIVEIYYRGKLGDGRMFSTLKNYLHFYSFPCHFYLIMCQYIFGRSDLLAQNYGEKHKELWLKAGMG